MTSQRTRYHITNVSRETLDKSHHCYEDNAETYSCLIDKWMWWNRSVNLFSRNTTAEQLKLHILHSLLLLHEKRAETYDIVLDAGTGGGLPGLPMAIADSGTSYYLIDKVYKKHIALKNISRKLSINNAFSICDDLKNLNINKPVGVVSKHAFHLPDLLLYLQNCAWIEISLLKGDDLFDELDVTLTKDYDISIKKIDSDNSFFYNKFIVSILNQRSSPSQL